MVMIFIFHFLLYFHEVYSAVTLTTSGHAATIANEYITVKFDAHGTGHSLALHGKEFIGHAKGFYSSINGGTGFSASSMKVVTHTQEMTDIAYESHWGELHYVVRSGVSGIYSYFIATGIGTVGEFRTIYRFNGHEFRDGFNAERSGPFPTLNDIHKGTKLQDETWQLSNHTVYSKYDWATYVADDRVHGVYGKGVGAWMISPSHEYINGGPMKQELMVHVESNTEDGTLLNMLSASHFGTPSVTIPNGKIYGPWLLYFNTGNSTDAINRYKIEAELWPYKWLSNPHYPLIRSTVTGVIKLSDGREASGAMVVLAAPGGDLYKQGANYIYYNRADSHGHFTIPHVRMGSYTLYAYAMGGHIGDVTDQYEHNVNINGVTVNLGTLTWGIKKYSHTLWQIGTADRRATEFKLGNVPRQFGLFKQVPANLEYTIGKSSPANNWYYAQTHPGQWTVHFNVQQTYTGTAHLTIAAAGHSRTASIEVLVNEHNTGKLQSFVNDASIYRDNNKSGWYHVTIVNFNASLLKHGTNTIVFKALSVSDGGGLMYDTVKLEIE